MGSDDGIRASIVIPAHNEQAVIGRLLDRLLAGAVAGELEIIVVCNGCTDNTFDIAQGFGPSIHVIDIPQPSKSAALAAGDAAASCFPRLYVDADVEVGLADVRALIDAIDATGALAAAPERLIPRAGVGALVRAYYNVWEQLPNVRSSLAGRGVIAVSEAGYRRSRTLPEVMADDLAISEAFSPSERVIVQDASVVVHPARRLSDLVRRRTRVRTGNVQLRRVNDRQIESRTACRSLVDVACTSPALMLQVPVFVVVTVVARLSAHRRARSDDFGTWLRDESSRA